MKTKFLLLLFLASVIVLSIFISTKYGSSLASHILLEDGETKFSVRSIPAEIPGEQVAVQCFPTFGMHIILISPEGEQILCEREEWFMLLPTSGWKVKER